MSSMLSAETLLVIRIILVFRSLGRACDMLKHHKEDKSRRSATIDHAQFGSVGSDAKCYLFCITTRWQVHEQRTLETQDGVAFPFFELRRAILAMAPYPSEGCM